MRDWQRNRFKYLRNCDFTLLQLITSEVLAVYHIDIADKDSTELI